MVLNDDCLMIIFNHLNIRDQITIARVCRRFRALITTLWSRTYVHFTDSNIRHILYPEYSVLMKCISPFVQTMKLEDLTFERFHVLKRYRYPKLTCFTFYYPNTLKDENILEMTKIFPALTSFSPMGAFSGKYIENWRHLQHLDLSNCDKKSFSCFEKIFERSHLKSLILNVFRRSHKWTSRRAFKNFCDLERITVNSYELKWIDLNLTQFSNLKELTVEDRDKYVPFRDLLRSLHEFKHNDIIELETIIPFPFCVATTDIFENLRKLTINYRNITEFCDLHDNAPNLREITFKECEIWDESDLNFIFADFGQLELFSIEQSYCAFRKLNINVDEIVRNRTKVLRFNFYSNAFLDLDDDYDISFMNCISINLNVVGSSDFLIITEESSSFITKTLRVRFQ